MNPINTALCSFGMSGKIFHAPFIVANPQFILHGVWERTKQLAVERYPWVKTYRTLSELLHDSLIELVVVNTPSVTHFDIARQALLAGKHVVVEKPFTPTVAEANELIELANKVNRLITVYHNRRYDCDFKVLRRVLADDLIGEMVDGEFRFDRYVTTLSPKAHKEAATPGVGILYDLGSHLIDQALALFGVPEAIYADIATNRPGSLVDDYFDLKLFFARHRLSLSASYYVREAPPAYQLHGRRGSFLKQKSDVQEADLIAGKRPDEIPNWGAEPMQLQGVLHTENNGEIIKTRLAAEPGNYGEFYQALYGAIRNSQALPVSPEDAKRVIKIIEKAFESNQLKKMVPI